MNAPSSVTPQDFPEIRWHGHWIWAPDDPVAPGSPFGDLLPVARPESHGLFRKMFALGEVPAVVPARITADSRYVLYANGQEVLRGPVRSQPRRMHYDFFDLAPYLAVGENLLAVYVKYFGTPRTYWMPAVPNATLGRSGVMVFEANLGDGNWLVSDANWRARRSDAWLADGEDEGASMVVAGVPVESFDARRLDRNWPMVDFDDRAWGAARVITPTHIGGRGRSQPPTDPYGPLFPRPIGKLGGAIVMPVTVAVTQLEAAPDLSGRSPAFRLERALLNQPADMQEVATLPVTVEVPAGGQARVRLDMGRIVAGLVEFAVRAPDGTVFDIHYVEEPLTAPSTFGAHGGSRYVARGEDDVHSVFDPKGLRYVYVLIHGAAGYVTLESFSVREYLYPWQPGASFACSDERLNRLYAAAIRTVQLNSWDAFMDCPTREQRAWVGDAVVHQMVHLTTNTDWRLAWHYLALGNSPRSDGILPMSVAGDLEQMNGFTIPDWSLHWVHGVHNLYRFQGDRARVKEYMPTIERILRWYLPYLTGDGVLQDVVEWNLIDWSSLFSEERSAIVTASWARGLREFAELAGWLGENGSQAWAEELYTRVKVGFEIFWDEGRGIYVDYVKDGVQQRPVNQLASALAIVAGLAPEERQPRIIAAITDAARLVVRSWMFSALADSDPGVAVARRARMFMGGLEPDWDVEREIVIAEPFMSYVVHDAVALAGAADRLPDLCLRWLDFLVDGYDTLGENWGTGTHVHGWSSTPAKDLVLYTLGVTPAAPGYSVARIAPRLGRLAWAKGSVPTPHGLIHVEVSGARITVDSPVPVWLELPGAPRQHLPPGQHEVGR